MSASVSFVFEICIYCQEIVAIIKKNAQRISVILHAIFLEGPVHTKPEKLETTAFIISTARSTVHTNPSRKRSFTKTLLTPEEFENAALRFSVSRRHLMRFQSRESTVFKFLRRSAGQCLSRVCKFFFL